MLSNRALKKKPEWMDYHLLMCIIEDQIESVIGEVMEKLEDVKATHYALNLSDRFARWGQIERFRSEGQVEDWSVRANVAVQYFWPVLVLSSQQRGSERMYHVHYVGYGTDWDCWRSAGTLRKQQRVIGRLGQGQSGRLRGDLSMETVEVGDRVECCVEQILSANGKLEKRCTFTSVGYSYCCWIAGTVSARVGGWQDDEQAAACHPGRSRF